PVPVPGGLPEFIGPPAPLPPPSKPQDKPKPAPLPKSSPPRQYRILPRSGENFDVKREELPGGRQIIVDTRVAILNVRNVPNIGSVDLEADRAVIWTRDGNSEGAAANLQSERGSSSSELEFYLAGHVIMRVQDPSGKDKTVLESDEIYYDTNRN